MGVIDNAVPISRLDCTNDCRHLQYLSPIELHYQLPHIKLLFDIQKSTSNFDVLFKPYLKFLICLLSYYISVCVICRNKAECDISEISSC